MRKTYICPHVLVTKLNTVHSLLALSGGNSGTLGISEDTKSSVWAREDNSWDIWGSDNDYED